MEATPTQLQFRAVALAKPALCAIEIEVPRIYFKIDRPLIAIGNCHCTKNHCQQDVEMPLLTTGKPFIRDLEQAGALGIYIPLEGGYEGRYQRRLRANGYESMHISARGLGDVGTYLTAIHGVRPAHLGKKDIRTYYIPPLLDTHLANLLPTSKGLVLWLIDGQVLSNQELAYLTELPKIEPRVKVVIELGGDRQFRWVNLKDLINT